MNAYTDQENTWSQQKNGFFGYFLGWPFMNFLYRKMRRSQGDF